MWSIVYSVPGMRSWLQRHNFSYKKPALVPGKANELKQREWLAEYENLKRNLPVDETICFMDGVHPTHNVQPAYGWIQKGVIPNVTQELEFRLSQSLGVCRS